MSTIWCLSVLLMAPVPAGLLELFETSSHDFGNVPHGSVSTYNFVLNNTTRDVISVDSVRSSCRCATPRIVEGTAQPGEKIVIEVVYNASTFTGPRGMTIYTSFTQPRYETVSLRVSGYSRQDVVFSPGQADLGVVSKGEGAKNFVSVEYAGRSDWKIDGIVPADHFSAEIVDEKRQSGRTTYRLAVSLANSAPAGSLNEVLQLKTNDDKSPILRLHATAVVESALSASPETLDLGTFRTPSQKIAKRVILRGRKPFTIVAVGGQADDLLVKMSQGPRTVHLIEVELTAGAELKAETINREIVVHTDIPEAKTLPVAVTARISPPSDASASARKD